MNHFRMAIYFLCRCECHCSDVLSYMFSVVICFMCVPCKQPSSGTSIGIPGNLFQLVRSRNIPSLPSIQKGYLSCLQIQSPLGKKWGTDIAHHLNQALASQHPYCAFIITTSYFLQPWYTQTCSSYQWLSLILS